jgi:XTP/dITP diphosphohydrolase
MKNYELYKLDTVLRAVFCLPETGSYSQILQWELPFCESGDSTFHESIKRGRESMTTDMPLVLATRNRGKIREMSELLKGYPVRVLCLDDFGPTPEVVEDGTTFEENAYKKASFVARILGFPALADDSGLVVDALGGAPGIYSARFGGEGLTDAERCERLLSKMAGETNRKAAFHCVLSLAVPAGQALTYEATCEGQIADAGSGNDGFGYDPIFYYPPLDKTFAQISRADKSSVSHRGKALLELQSEFEKVLVWVRQHMPDVPKQGCLGS